MNSVTCVFLVALALHRFTCSCERISLDFFPNPTKAENAAVCGNLNAEPSYICDPESVFTSEDRLLLEDRLAELKHDSIVKCPVTGSEPQRHESPKKQGIEFGIAIIKNVANYRTIMSAKQLSVDASAVVSAYAKVIHDNWGVGDRFCNNGALLFVSMTDRALHVSTGKALRQAVGDSMISDWLIPERMAPLMRRKQLAKAIIQLIDDLADVSKGYYAQNPVAGESKGVWHTIKWLFGGRPQYGESAVYLEYSKWLDSFYLFRIPLFGGIGVTFEWLLFICVIGAVVAYQMYQQKQQDEYLKCRASLNRIHAQARARRFNQEQCPICLEDLPNADGSNEGEEEENKDESGGEERSKTVLLGCGHRFCEDCINSWFEGRRGDAQRCPVCRRHWSEFELGEDKEAKDEHKHDDEGEEHSEEDSGGAEPGAVPRRKEASGSAVDGDSLYTGPSASAAAAGTGAFGSGVRQRRANGAGNSWFQGQSSGRRGGHWQSQDWFLRQDLMFRLARMQRMYPAYVNSDMVSRWTRPGYDMNTAFATDNTFATSDPSYAPPQTGSSSSAGSSWTSRFASSGRSSRSSSFRSFGGGRSAGGGGGSW